MRLDDTSNNGSDSEDSDTPEKMGKGKKVLREISQYDMRGERHSIWIIRPEEDENIRRWKYNIDLSKELSQSLNHPNILRIRKHEFIKHESPENKHECTMTCDYCTELGIDKIEAKRLFSQLLEVLAYLEKCRILLVGKLESAILVDTSTMDIKIALHSFKRILPRWYTQEVPKYIKPKLNEILIEKDKEYEAIHSWAEMMKSFLSNEGNQYKESNNTPSDKDSKGISFLVKAAYTSESSDYPSFTLLYKLSKKVDCKEEMISKLIKNSCKVCGDEFTKDECKYCDDPSKVLSSIEENPYAAIRLIPRLPEEKVTNSVKTWTSEFAKVSECAHIEFLKCIISYYLTKKDYTKAIEYINTLIDLEKTIKTVNANSIVMLNLNLIANILPYKGLLLPELSPNSFTIPQAPEFIELKKVVEVGDVVWKILLQSAELNNDYFISQYTRFLLTEQYARCFFFIEKKNIADYIEELKKKLTKYKDKTPNKRVKKINMNERLLRLLMETRRYGKIKDVIEALKHLLTDYYPEQELKEYLNIFKLVIMILEKNIKEAQEILNGMKELTSETNNSLIEHYKALILKYEQDEKNLHAFDKLGKHASKAKDPEALFYRAIEMKAEKNDDKMHKVLEKAVSLAKKNSYSNYSMKTMIFFEFANELYRSSSYRRAKEFYEKAYEACKKVTLDKDLELLPRIWLGITNTYRLINSGTETVEKYEVAIKEVKKFYGNKSKCLVRLLVNFATFELQLGNRSKAIECIKEVKDVLSEIEISTELFNYIEKIEECTKNKTQIEVKKEEVKEELMKKIKESEDIKLLVEEIDSMIKNEELKLNTKVIARGLLDYLNFKEYNSVYVIQRCHLPFLKEALKLIKELIK